MSVARLDEVAYKSSDTEWARTMVTARGTLLRQRSAANSDDGIVSGKSYEILYPA